MTFRKVYKYNLHPGFTQVEAIGGNAKPLYVGIDVSRDPRVWVVQDEEPVNKTTRLAFISVSTGVHFLDRTEDGRYWEYLGTFTVKGMLIFHTFWTSYANID